MLEKHNYIKTYNAKITTKGPLYIGSGEHLRKKDYITLLENNSLETWIVFPEWKKLYKEIIKRNLDNDFTEFLKDKNQKSLYFWLKEHNINKRNMIALSKYTLNTRANIKNCKDLMPFMKNGLGEPYIPGSSLKGYIRSALLAWEIAKNPNKYQNELNVFLDDLNNYKFNFRKIRATKLESKVFNTLNNNPKNKDDAVNSNLSGLIIGDSSPKNTCDLTIYQLEDLKINKDVNRLPILLECLKENIDIDIRITIDSTRCPYTIEDIKEAIKFYANIVDDDYFSYFKSSLSYEKEENSIFLGGHAGFSSKTVISSLCNQDTKYQQELTAKILNRSQKKIKFKNYPRVCHCVKEENVRLPIGHCTLSI